MTDKLFDDFVKTKLENFDSGAPMHVWERIKDDKDRKPKGFFLWQKPIMLLLAGLFISGGAVYFSLDQKNDAAISSIVSSTEFKNNQEKIQKQTQTSDNNIELNAPLTTTVDNGSNLNSASVTSASTAQQVNQIAFKDNFIQKKKQRSSITKQQGFPVIVTDKKNHAVTTSSSNSTNTLLANQKAVSETVKEKLLSPATLVWNRDALSSFRIGAVAMPQNKPSCPSINGPRRRDLYLETYFSPDYNIRSLSASGTSGTYIDERNATENYRTSFSAGARLVKNLGEKTLLKGGINYTQINERLRIVTENSKQLTQVITIRTVVRSPGDTLFVRDTMFYEQTGTRYRTTYNRYRFIDVPVIFSYEFGNPELMHFAVNAGPVFNIISFYNGEVMDTAYKPLAISTASGTNANNWRNNIGMGVFASVSIFKKLNDRIHLFGEPYVRYNLNPVTQQNNFVKQRYLITGMQLGIRYNFIPPGQRYKR
jgi:hypothetical protein